MTLDAVNLCEMTRNDRHTVRALFLLGANDGVLPAAENRGGVLRNEDREALERQQIFLAPHGMEQFHLEIQNLYAALAQPTEKLTVSYPFRTERARRSGHRSSSGASRVCCRRSASKQRALTRNIACQQSRRRSSMRASISAARCGSILKDRATRSVRLPR